MVREKELFLIRLMKTTDALMLAASFFIAYFLTLAIRDVFDLGPLGYAEGGIFYFYTRHLWLIVITIPAWIGLMSVDGVYQDFRTKIYLEILWKVFKTGLISVLFLGSGVFLLQMEFTSRLYVGIFAATAYILIALSKAVWRWILDYTYRQGINLVNILIVGTGPRAHEFINVVRAHANWGLEIVGLVDDDPKLLGKKVADYEVIGRITDIPRLIREFVVDRVIFVVPRLWLNRIENAIFYCEREGISTAITVDLYKPKLAKLHQTDFAGIPMIVYQTANAKEWQLFIKRILDVFIAITGLLLLSPLMIFIALLIKYTSKGPIFFRQVRSGLNGRKFTLYKFRSMQAGAEVRQKELAKRNEMDGPVFKIKHDPRITAVGRFMRKLSIDELPQLLNVLKGDMSLVGPRPPIPAEVEMYESWQRRRLSMKPGLTCIWQVSGRNNIDFDRWMELDLMYIDNFSLWKDFKILFRTFFVVLTGYGAA